MTKKEAMCAHLGCDSVRDMEDGYRYQPRPRERYPLYSVDEWYFTYGMVAPGTSWEVDPDQFFARMADTIIWRKPMNA